MQTIKFYISIILFLCSTTLFAQLEFTTEVSKNKLGVNQRFRIIFSVNKQGADNFKAPNFNHFKVVGGPSSSVNQSWINGKSTYSQSYIYILQPKNTGAFTIPPATIEYKGKTISSNSVKIEVTKAVEIPKDPNNPEYITQQNLHLVAEVSKANPYLGEGIYVEYKLFFNNKIKVYEYEATDVPSYSGFWNQDVRVSGTNIKKGKYNGENYYYVILKRVVLIPQRSGNLKIEPLKMDFSVGVPTGKGDWFGNMITKNIRYTHQSPTRIIKVKPLPKQGKPENFTGAVGEFNFKVNTNKNELKANEATQVKVEIKGKGNLKLFEIPKITTPPELEVYTPEYKEDTRTSLSGLQGNISNTYTMVPQYKGKYKIPEVKFSYFSPKEKKYKTIKSNAIIINVTQGKELPKSVVSNTPKQQVISTNSTFRYIATKTKFISSNKTNFLGSKWFYILLLLPLLVVIGTILIAKKREAQAKDIFGNRIRKADRLARKYLSQARKQLGKKEAFYIALEKALHNFLKAKLQIETADISKEKIAELLEKKKVKKENINQLLEVLKSCDFARYTPTTNVMMKQEFDKAKQVITQIDKQL